MLRMKWSLNPESPVHFSLNPAWNPVFQIYLKCNYNSTKKTSARLSEVCTYGVLCDQDINKKHFDLLLQKGEEHNYNWSITFLSTGLRTIITSTWLWNGECFHLHIFMQEKTLFALLCLRSWDHYVQGCTINHNKNVFLIPGSVRSHFWMTMTLPHFH